MSLPVAEVLGVVVRFYRCLDDRDYDGLVALMTPDGCWKRQGVVLTGSQAVKAALSRRSSSMRIAHLLTNLSAVPDGPNSMAVTAYMLVVRHDPGPGAGEPSPLTGIENIRTIRARIVAGDGGWLIATMAGDPPSFARPS